MALDLCVCITLLASTLHLCRLHYTFRRTESTKILGMKSASGAAEGLRFRIDLRGGRGYGARKEIAEIADLGRSYGTVMNFVNIHLLLNHFPVMGSIIGFGLFLISLFGKNDDLRRGSLIIFAAMALIAIPAFASGKGAQLMLHGKPGISDDFMQRHEGAAILALWFLEATGAFAVAALWQLHRRARMGRWNLTAVLIFSLLTVGFMVRTGNTGGEISHTEVRASQEATPTEGTVGLIVHLFEPTPWKFTQAMTYNKWWWAFMMDLHFLGLVLLIGSVGAFGIRNQRRDRSAGVHRHAGVLHVGLCFLGQVARHPAAWSECGGVLFDRRFRRSQGPGTRRRCAALRQARRGKFFDPVVRRDHSGPLHPVLSGQHTARAVTNRWRGAEPVKTTSDNREIF